MTGLAQTVEGLTGKLIELVQEFVPGAVRVGFLSIRRARPCGTLRRVSRRLREVEALRYSPNKR